MSKAGVDGNLYVLLKFPEKFKRPTADEAALYDVYCGPDDRSWEEA